MWHPLSVYSQDSASAVPSIRLEIQFIGKDSSLPSQFPEIKTSFTDLAEAKKYAAQIPERLSVFGYPAASMDSLLLQENKLLSKLYLGPFFSWTYLNTDAIDRRVLEAVGYRASDFQKRPVSFLQLRQLQERLLQYYENNGYPFASLKLRDIKLESGSLSASLMADLSVPYRIDSIRIQGDADISNRYMQHYLSLRPAAVFSKQKLAEVDKKLTELPFLSSVQPSTLTLLGSGSILNLYLTEKKAGQVSFLLGLLPASGNNNKPRLTGDFLLDLKNVFGGGQSLLVKWQQLQAGSPRLNLGYNHPYMLNSQLGFDFNFDLFRKDSSFMQLNGRTGLDYAPTPHSKAQLFLQWQSNDLLLGGVDTNTVKNELRLPDNADMRSFGLGLRYEYGKTNYKFNPQRGNEFFLNATVGKKRILKNDEVTSLNAGGKSLVTLYDSMQLETYQIRIILNAAHYFPLGKYAVIKTAVNSGLYNSPNIFRNELFQIGGFALLRGFDDESIFSTAYVVNTAEFRYLIAANSYFFGFADAAISKKEYAGKKSVNRFLGTGIGLVYETKPGLIRIAYAVGVRDDLRFNIREASKIHFGYIHYF
jgi:outer membrane protein assembly factor BamA